MKLYISTTDQKQIYVGIKKGGEIFNKQAAKNLYGSQVLMELIGKLLRKKGLRYEDIESIEVERGPGSFTGIRVGVSVANALGFALKIPVNGKNMETDLVYA